MNWKALIGRANISTIACATISLSLCTLLVACGGSPENAKGTENTKSDAGKSVTIAQFGHVFLYMPLYVAVRKGFFAKNGLDVKLVSTGGDEKTFTAVSTGNAQFGVADPTFAAIARERGQGGKVVASVVSGAPFWVIAFGDKYKPSTKSDILSGARVATYSAPSTSYAVMKQLLQNQGKPIKATIVEGAFGTLIPMLKANQADLAMEIEPVVSTAIENGAHVVYEPKVGEFAFTGLTVSDAFCQEHPEQIQAAVNALNEAMQFIHNDPDGAIAVAREEFPESSESVIKAALNRLRESKTVPQSPMLNTEAWNNAIKLRREIGDIEGPGSYEDNVDMSFVKKIPANVK